MKKKLIAGMMVAMMVVGMVMPVSAAELTPTNPSGSTNVTYEEGNNWNVTIPAKVDLYTDKGTDSQITASMVNIAPGKALQISVSSGISGGKVTLARENGTSADNITSTVSLTEGASSGIADDAVVAEFSGSQFEGTINPIYGGTLYFSKLEGTNIKAGSYTGTINFVMNVVDSSNSGN